jgi:hypothetical protein
MNSAQKAVLGPQLREALNRLGSKLAANESIESELKIVLCGLNQLPAHAMVRAVREINITARLYHLSEQPRHALFGRLSWPTEMDDLKRYPGIEYLFIFHGDGYVREAALKQIESGLPSPFLFAAIAWRLNDWAPPVRIAAAECAKRTFPQTAAEIVAQAAMALLSRESSWRRWTTERALLIEAFSRPDVAAAFTEIIEQKRTG